MQLLCALRTCSGVRVLTPDLRLECHGDDQQGDKARPHDTIMTDLRQERGRTRRLYGSPGRSNYTEQVSWLSTFNRFRPGRVPLVGPVALFVADWSRPQRGEAPMFDSPLLERLSVVRPLYPTAVYLPAGLFLLWRSATGLAGPLTSAGLYLAGLLAWSLLEYGAHRGSFHHEPQNQRQLAVAYLIHGVHHAYPDDSRRWMLPLAVTIPVTSLLYLGFRAALGVHADASFAGFVHGYLSYDLVHYFIHRGRMPGRIGRFLRQHHMAHHYSKPERNFGVSSPLWDVVFRTR